jgi:prepilin-type N-terminal cleavage/methylation domain-containing protein
MRKTQAGFTAIEFLIVIVFIAVIGGVGYHIYHDRYKPVSLSLSNTAAVNTTGSSVPSNVPAAIQNINSLTSQQASSEASIDSQYSSNDQADAQGANAAASNLGGAYNEAAF